MSLKQICRKCRNCRSFFRPDYRHRFTHFTAQTLIVAGPARQLFSAGGCAKAITGITFEEPGRLSACRSGDRAIQATGEKRPPSRRTLKALKCRPLTPSTNLVTYFQPPLGTLQDFWVPQEPGFIGLLSMITSSTLQEEIGKKEGLLFILGEDNCGFKF